jgi:hypothetical protein
MDQGAMVSEQVENGKKLIQVLSSSGIDLGVAFWAQLPEEGQWFLYLSSPVVDEKGPTAAYRLVHDLLRKNPDLFIDPWEIRMVGVHDSLAEGALAAIKPRIPDGPFAIRTPKPYGGMTRFNGSTLGGVDVDGAYIYPPPQAVEAE